MSWFAPRTKRIDRGSINDYLARRTFFFNPKIKTGCGTRVQLPILVTYRLGHGSRNGNAPAVLPLDADAIVNDALGMLETTGYTPAMVALDAMEKSAGIRVIQAEINDFLGIIIKLSGSPDQLNTALDTGYRIAAGMGGQPVKDVINRPDSGAWKAIESPSENNPLIQQDVVHFPTAATKNKKNSLEQSTVTQTTSFALGFIETQGFTAVFEAIDTACKAASVEVVGKEKLGGGYVTVVIKGDVAAVNAAIEAARCKVDGLGTLIAAHVIPRPSQSVLSLLPKV